MPVELPKKNTRTLPIVLTIGALAASAIVTLATRPKDEPAPRMQVVGVVAVRSADPTSTGSRVPDPLQLPKKKAKKKATPPASTAGTATANVASTASSGVASSGSASTGSAARSTGSSGGSTRSSGGSSSSKSTSGTSAAEAEFGPG